MKKCKEKDCDNKHLARGFCAMHYNRYKTHGDAKIALKVGRKFKYKTLKDAFEGNFEPITESGCWIWTKSDRDNSRRYGQICWRKRSLSAHRVSYELYVAKIEKNMIVCHKCDIPSCVNPSHLFIGTVQDNSDDMVKKGRQCKGTRCHRNKLKESQVLNIKKLLSKNVSCSAIGRMYGAHYTTIIAIKDGETWKHLNDGQAA